MQRDTLVDLQGHDAVDDQIVHLVGIVDIGHGEEVDARGILRAALEREDGRRVARGDGALQLDDGLSGPLVQVGNMQKMLLLCTPL